MRSALLTPDKPWLQIQASHLTRHLLGCCALSTTPDDICSTTSTIPKLLNMILSGNNTISFTQCFTQTFFFLLAASAEDILLFIMALTSYVKIIKVILKIQSTDGKKKAFSTCSSHLAVIILYYATGASMYMIPPSKYSHAIEQIATILCTAVTPMLNPLIYSLRNKEVKKGLRKEGRRKAFSTCSSHLIVMVIYYSTGGSHVMSSFYHTGDLLNQILSMFYTTIVPTINPLVCSLRNNEIKKALQRLWKAK
ncbi:olfactory receptor 2D3-like [Hyla sarda]|uniref:olfactory receptor 2D3-like n=1 Tax=Hyla sarda TaxID=327740 RepID=UPI0024C4665D|nr:olfactory receptor 2D3-like [Hyla sarda]